MLIPKPVKNKDFSLKKSTMVGKFIFGTFLRQIVSSINP